jgi:uncharacterized protein (TIGR02145 family)
MKNINRLLLGLLLAFSFSVSTVRAQNDTMYVMKNGVVINKQSLKETDVDSIVFYKVTTTPACGGSVTFTYNGASVTYGTVASAGKCWLDRNLGATQVATKSTDEYSYGDLFQWGRGADGHQRSGTISTLSASDVPGHAKFILAPSSPYDWRSPQNDNLWQGVNGTNNPCPSGYRVPTEAEFVAERTSWGSDNSAGAFASPLKLTMAGFRNGNDGSYCPNDINGLYWCSTVDGVNSRLLHFKSNSANMFSNNRADALAVRCIKN